MEGLDLAAPTHGLAAAAAVLSGGWGYGAPEEVVAASFTPGSRGERPHAGGGGGREGPDAAPTRGSVVATAGPRGGCGGGAPVEDAVVAAPMPGGLGTPEERPDSDGDDDLAMLSSGPTRGRGAEGGGHRRRQGKG